MYLEVVENSKVFFISDLKASILSVLTIKKYPIQRIKIKEEKINILFLKPKFFLIKIYEIKEIKVAANTALVCVWIKTRKINTIDNKLKKRQTLFWEIKE